MFLYNPSSKFSELTVYLPHIIICTGLCCCLIICQVHVSVYRQAVICLAKKSKILIPGPQSGDSLRSSRIGPRKVFKITVWVILMNNRPEHFSSGDRSWAFLFLAVLGGPAQWPARSGCSVNMFWVNGQASFGCTHTHMLTLSVISLALCCHCSLLVPLFFTFPLQFHLDCWPSFIHG